jgi:hypothetical protein
MSSFVSLVSPLMTPTNPELINKIEKLKEIIMQKDQQIQTWKNEPISLNQAMILIKSSNDFNKIKQ